VSPERFARLREALVRRQPDLTVLLEGVHKPHNLSAVVRTCDAVGAYRVHAVPPRRPVMPRARGARAYQGISGGVRRYVGVRSHRTLGKAVGWLREHGFQLLAAHPSPESVDFREADYTRPTAILLGQERDGLSDEALEAADRLLSLPMLGLGASLNVSVAAALFLFEAQRQRLAAGLYDASRLDPAERHKTLFEWAYPDLAKHCRKIGFPYPPLGEDGEVLGDVPRG
jgi:tRNA (guanosine-2'-O-)-methyltransferase